MNGNRLGLYPPAHDPGYLVGQAGLPGDPWSFQFTTRDLVYMAMGAVVGGLLMRLWR